MPTPWARGHGNFQLRPSKRNRLYVGQLGVFLFCVQCGKRHTIFTRTSRTKTGCSRSTGPAVVRCSGCSSRTSGGALCGKSHVRVVRVVRVEHAQAGRNSLLKADASIRPPKASVAYRQQGPSGAFGFCFVTWMCGCATPPQKKEKKERRRRRRGVFFCGRRQMATGHRTTAAPRPFAQRRARPPRGFGALP